MNIEIKPEELKDLIHACESMELVNHTIRDQAFNGLLEHLNLKKQFDVHMERSNKKYEALAQNLRILYDNWNNGETA